MYYFDNYEEHMDYHDEYETYEENVSIKVMFNVNKSDETLTCVIPYFTVHLSGNEEVQDYLDSCISKVSGYHKTTPEIQYLLEAIYEQPFMEELFKDETLEVTEILSITEPTDDEVEEVMQVIRKKDILKHLVNAEYRMVATNLVGQYGRKEMLKMLMDNEVEDTNKFDKKGKLHLITHLIYEQIKVYLHDNDIRMKIREFLETMTSYHIEKDLLTL